MNFQIEENHIVVCLNCMSQRLFVHEIQLGNSSQRLQKNRGKTFRGSLPANSSGTPLPVLCSGQIDIVSRQPQCLMHKLSHHVHVSSVVSYCLDCIENILSESLIQIWEVIISPVKSGNTCCAATMPKCYKQHSMTTIMYDRFRNIILTDKA